MEDHFIDFHQLEGKPYFPIGVNTKTTASIRRADPRNVMQVVFLDLMALFPSGEMSIGREVTFDWLWNYLVPAHIKRTLGLGNIEILYVPLIETAIASQAPVQREQLLRIFSIQQLALEKLSNFLSRYSLPGFVVVPDYELIRNLGLAKDKEFLSSAYLGRKAMLANRLACSKAELRLLFVEQTASENLHDHIGLRGEPCGMALAHCCPAVIDFLRTQYDSLACYFFLQPGSYSGIESRKWAGIASAEEVECWSSGKELGHRISIGSSASMQNSWPDLTGREMSTSQMRKLLYGAISSMFFCQLAEEIFVVPFDLPSPQQAWELSKQITEGSNVFQLSLDKQIAVYAIWRAHGYPYALWLHEQLSVNSNAAEELTQRLIRSDIL